MSVSRQKNIALVAERWNHYSRRFIEGVARFTALHENWTVSLFDFVGFEKADVKLFDGFICRQPEDRTDPRLIRLGRPIVDCMHVNPFDASVSVTSDVDASGRLAAEHFLSRRHTRFAYCGFNSCGYSEARAQAFQKHLKLHGMTANIYQPPASAARQFAHFNRFGTPLTIPDARVLAAWLKQLPKPIALFCSNDRRAAHVLQLCREAGIRVPAEIAICGVDNDPVFCSLATPRLTSIDPDAETVGFGAAQALAGLLGESNFECPRRGSQITFPPKGLIARASTAIGPLEPEWLSDALLFIRTHIAENLTANDVISYLKLSHSTVNDTFRKKLGTTVQKEIANTRIETARRLLLETDMSVAQIARQAGFASTEYFCNCFATSTGCTPSDFRK